MKVFKQLFRSVVLVGFAGGWALAASAVHVVRTPTNKFPVILTKEHLGYSDTYADTTKWTLADDKAHPILVARLIELNRSDLLKHTLSPGGGTDESQLAAAVQNPIQSPSSDLANKAKTEFKSVADTVKSKLN